MELPRPAPSIQARLGLLALIGTASTVLVALTALLSLGAHATGDRTLSTARSVLHAQEQGELHLAQLRIDITTVVRADPADRSDGLTRAAVSLARVRVDLDAGLQAHGPGPGPAPDPDLGPLLVPARQALEQQLDAAQALLRVSAQDPAAARQSLVAYDRQGDDAAAAMAGVTGQLTARVVERDHEVAAAAGNIARRIWTSVVVGLVAPFVLCGLIARSVGASVRGRDDAQRALREANDRLTADATRERFDATLKNAFEMAVTEAEAHTVVRRAVLASAAGHRAELLLADNSSAHLSRVMTEPGGDAPGCGVLSPGDCIAVRRGRAAVFDSAEGIASCPKLEGRGSDIGQAVCSPVTFLGAGLGVLHVVTRPGAELSADALRDLSVTAEQAGNRIGTLRAFSRSQLQAHTDGLTGLLNRRTVEERISELGRTSRQLTLALCDLDHFKRINDTFGHEAGDRALRVFSATLRAVVRVDDLVARYGGEEFLIVLPDAGLLEAQATAERVQTELALALQPGGAPSFTVSFGIAVLQPGHDLDEAMRLADGALMRAKAEGRNRVVLAAA